MSSSPTHPMLRLVGARVSPKQHTLRPGNTPRRADVPVRAWVGSENVSASGLTVDDARWMIATQAASMIEGGTQAQLRPERRRKLHDMATQVGLRPFDTNLVIAIVQDAVRHEKVPLSPATVSRLKLVRPAPTEDADLASKPVVAPAIASVVLALMGMAFLVEWVLTTR